MKAMIFAAGLGTRLKPLTNDKPKALIQLNGKTLLEITIKRLIKAGFDELIINVHHFAEQIIDFIKQNNNFGIRIEISDERGLLLDTGGGLKKAAWFFNDNKSFLAHNVDIVSDINLKELYTTHEESGSIATLAVSKRSTSRYLLFDSNNQLSGWKNTKINLTRIVNQAAKNPIEYAFSGIEVISPAIFPLITEEGYFSIIDVYLRLARKHRIASYVNDNKNWIDVGKKENLRSAEEILKLIKYY